ncbi:MAG: hypothetical protein ABWZ99_15685, partial [Ilumatobacteraceae bacterium]
MPGQESRRRASRRRYMVRRVVALGIVGLIVFGAVRVVGSLTSGDDPVADAQEPGSTVAESSVVGSDATTPAGSLTPDVTGSADGSTPVTDGSVTDGSVADTSTEGTGPPTAEDPAKVYIVGDSDAGTFGPYLQTLLDGTTIVDT